jgi:hypothetical protein
MPSYGLLTHPSNEILNEIRKIYDLNFDYVEIGIEGPEGNPTVNNKKRYDDGGDNQETLTWKRVSKYIYNTTAREGVIQTIPAG